MSTLPSRYRHRAGVLDQFKERVAVMQQGNRQHQAGPRPATVVGLALAAAVGIATLAAFDVRADRGTNARAPFDGQALVSAAGVAPTPRDFAPAGERPAAATLTQVPAIPTEAPEPTPREQLREITTASPGGAKTRRPAPTPRPTPRVVEVVFDDEAAQRRNTAAATPAASPTPTPRPVLNLGTRIPVRLLADATTALNGAPVSASLAADVLRDGRVLLPAGTVVHGDAYATPESDSRAQLTWSAIVLNGQTVRVAAVTLGADDQLGVPGRMVRKASRTKRGLGTVLGAVGRAVTFGAFGSGGVAQRAANETATRIGDGLDGMSREWTVSDKGIRVAAGTAATLVLRSDVVLP